MKKQQFEARAEAVVAAPLEEVWEAFATAEGFGQVYQGIEVGGDWKPGGRVFWAGEWEGRRFRDEGTILVYDRPHTFDYTYWTSFWGPAPRLDEMVLIHNGLEAVAGGTRVTVTQSRIPSAESRDHSQKSWEDTLKKLQDRLA